MQKHKGDKMTVGSPIDLGLSSREGTDKTAKLRGDTGAGQRPTEKKGNMSSDRGSFPTRS